MKSLKKTCIFVSRIYWLIGRPLAHAPVSRCLAGAPTCGRRQVTFHPALQSPPPPQTRCPPPQLLVDPSREKEPRVIEARAYERMPCSSSDRPPAGFLRKDFFAAVQRCSKSAHPPYHKRSLALHAPDDHAGTKEHESWRGSFSPRPARRTSFKNQK